MKTQYLLITTLLLAFFMAQATFAFEVPLKNYNPQNPDAPAEIFQGLSLNAPLDRNCQTVLIDFVTSSYAPPTENNETISILSLRAEFGEAKSDNSHISISINGGEAQIIWPEYLTCGTDCWARIFLPESITGLDVAEICVITGDKTNSAQIFSDSIAGRYNSPLITIKNSAPSEINLGERAKLTTVIKNTGTTDTNVFVQFVKEDTRASVKITSFDIIDGQSTVSSVLRAGEQREFSYYIKPIQASSYNLSSSIIIFDNVFGERQGIISNHPQMRVKDLSKIDSSLVVSQISANEFELGVIVRNNSDDQFKGIVSVAPKEMLLDINKEFLLGPKSEKTIYFYTSKLLEGSYSFTSNISDGNISYKSNEVLIEVRPPAIPYEIIFAIVAVIIALLVIYFYYRKEKAPETK